MHSLCMHGTINEGSMLLESPRLSTLLLSHPMRSSNAGPPLGRFLLAEGCSHASRGLGKGARGFNPKK